MVKFSKSLANEVRASGVYVTAVCPGFTLSEFHDVTGTRATVSQLPGWLWMDAPTVARQGFDAVMAGTPVYVTGRVNRTIAFPGPLPAPIRAGRAGPAYRPAVPQELDNRDTPQNGSFDLVTGRGISLALP